MKANELMIGDWVYNPLTRKKLRLTFGRDLDLAEELCLEPIPLTGEILEKNGWRGRSHTQWQFFRDGCDELNFLLGKDYTQVEYLNMIYNPEDNAEVNYSHSFEFPRTIYVHELQHVLRLCGIEKEIEL